MVYPRFPECVGIFRCIEHPTYDELLLRQIEDVQRSKGRGKLEDLFASEDAWVVE
jgi:2-oxoglutarate ferredoxin oxidoreductase subunit beta